MSDAPSPPSSPEGGSVSASAANFRNRLANGTRHANDNDEEVSLFDPAEEAATVEEEAAAVEEENTSSNAASGSGSVAKRPRATGGAPKKKKKVAAPSLDDPLPIEPGRLDLSVPPAKPTKQGSCFTENGKGQGYLRRIWS